MIKKKRLSSQIWRKKKLKQTQLLVKTTKDPMARTKAPQECQPQQPVASKGTMAKSSCSQNPRGTPPTTRPLIVL